MLFFFSSRRRHTRCAISDWSSDVCSSDLTHGPLCRGEHGHQPAPGDQHADQHREADRQADQMADPDQRERQAGADPAGSRAELESLADLSRGPLHRTEQRSEEHTSEPQSLMRNSYSDFCFKKKQNDITHLLRKITQHPTKLL